MTMDGLCLAAVGDVFVERPDPGAALTGITPLLRAADLVFGNFEGVLTDDHAAVPGASSAQITSPANASGVGVFDVLSLANNHAMDAGRGGLVDTTAALSALGVRTVGAGRDLAEALSPIVIDNGTTRVAILAVTAVLQHGSEARDNIAGVAPLRADDCYLPPYPGVGCPGVPPRVVSILDERDWERLAGAIERAKRDATTVVVSAHWGDHTRPWVLTDHERLCAELMVDAGANLVIGHHQHILRGTEFQSGVPVWYGLGHAVFDVPRLADELADNGVDVSALTAEQRASLFGEYGIYPRPEQPSFPFHPIARRTVVAVADLTADGVSRCGVVPCLIDHDGVARPVPPDSADWPPFVDFLTECQTRAGLGARVVAASDWSIAGHPVIEFRP